MANESVVAGVALRSVYAVVAVVVIVLTLASIPSHTDSLPEYSQVFIPSLAYPGPQGGTGR